MADFLSTITAVIVGGAITLASSLFLGYQRDKKEAEKEYQARENERKRAVRLLRSELSTTESVMRVSAKGKRWDPEYDSHISTEFWKQHAPVMAEQLDSDAWNALVLAYHAIQITMTERRALTERALNDVQVAGLQTDLRLINTALSYLKSMYN